MAQRPGILTTVSKQVDGGVSPNAYVPWVTAEIRCHWPPLATRDEILQALTDAYDQALLDIDVRRAAPVRGPQ